MALWDGKVLREEEPDPADPGGGGGDPPKDPDPKEGDPPKDPPPTSISLEVIPEDLRDRPEAEVKFMLEHMVSTLGSRNNQVEDLQKELAELRGEVRAAPPAEPDPDDDKPLAELMLEDPEKALDRWARDKGYVKAIGDLSDRVGESEFTMVAAAHGDFADHEDHVRKLLKEGKIAATRRNIEGAYTMALGEKLLEDRARDIRGKSGSIPPSPPAPPDPKGGEPEMSELEKEIMRGHGIEDPVEWVKYRDNPPELKLPT